MTILGSMKPDIQRSDVHAILAAAETSIELPIQWGEMDALGHVNNVVYFRYLESARVAHIHALGFDKLRFVPTEIDGRSVHVGFILQSVQARFRKPLFYPDRLIITTRLVNIEDDRFTLAHEIISTQQRVVAAVGEGTIVTYDYDAHTKVRVPAIVRDKLLALHASPKGHAL